MKIAMLTSDFFDTGHGGVEAHILGLSNALTEEGHEVTVVRAAPRESVVGGDSSVWRGRYVVLSSGSRRSRGLSRAIRLGGRAALLAEMSRRFWTGAKSALRVDEFIDAVGPVDLVHQHDFIESWGLGWRLARRQVPVVWTNHLGEFLFLRKLPGGRIVLKWLTSHYRQAIAPSSELADGEAIGVPVSMLPNGVDTRLFHPGTPGERDSARQQLGWVNKKVIIVPRRWAPTKGVVYVAEAMATRDWPTDSLTVFVGSGTSEYPGYKDRILDFLSRSNCRYEVHERVSPEEMARMLRASDVCLIPSLKEATSLSALEAMASEVPVVASSVGGLKEIIRDGETGYLHAPNSATAVASALSRALTDPSMRMVVQNASEKVRVNYSWSITASRTVHKYEAAL